MSSSVRLTRRHGIEVVLVLALVPTACRRDQSTRQPVAKGPNVLLIVLDTTRADFLSCYGFPRKTTPHIDRLADEGVRFRQAYSTSYWTLPAHASILTGVYPSEAGATSETHQLGGDQPSIAEILSKAGYQTCAIIQNAWISKERGFGRGFAEFHELWRDRASTNRTGARKKHASPVVEAVRGWLGRWEQHRDPFLLMLNINVPHLPYRPPRRLVREWVSNGRTDREIARLMAVANDVPQFVGAVDYDEKEFATFRELYAAEVCHTDEWVGGVLNLLRGKGILDSTLVILTADHGENIGEHNMLGHQRSMYDTTIHVPLIMRYPGQFDPGSVRDQLVSVIDIVPTILDISKQWNDRTMSHLRGVSLCDTDHAQRSYVFAEEMVSKPWIAFIREEYPDFNVDKIDCRYWMVRSRRHKLIRHEGRREELYDVLLDPEEQRDISRRDVRTQARLGDELDRWIEQLRVPTDVRQFTSKDYESIELLRGIGYVGRE